MGRLLGPRLTGLLYHIRSGYAEFSPFPLPHYSDLSQGVFIIADGPSYPPRTRIAGYYMGKLEHFAVSLSAHSPTDHSWRILLLHRLGCSSLHHLHRRAYCSMGLPEEGYVGGRPRDVLPMGPPDGSDVLGLRKG